MEKGYYSNDRLLYKKQAEISVASNCIGNIDRDLDRVIELLSPYFDLTITYQISHSADIYLLANCVDPSRDLTRYLANLANLEHEIVYERTGQIKLYDVETRVPNYSDKLIAYDLETDLSFVPAYSIPWNAGFFYEDAQLQRESFWILSGLNGRALFGATPIVSKTPDYATVRFFAGIRENTVTDESEWQFDQEDISHIIFPALFEEIVHSLVFWRDLPDNFGRVPFSGEYGNREVVRDGFKKMAQRYEQGIPEVLNMLSYYDLPGMRPGLTYSEVKAILDANE